MKLHSKILLFSMLVVVAIFFSGVIVSQAGVNFQQSVAQTEEKESSPEYIEQYEAWEKAVNESDIQKSGTMLIQFLEKYPKSEILKHAKDSYSSLLIKCSKEKKFQDLEALAEQWLKLHPGDLLTLAYIAAASKELGHNDKWIQTLIEIYKIQPSGDSALEIAQTFKKTNNKAKSLEWTETALTHSEYETDFRTRLELVQRYLEDKNSAKAVEYARSALKAAGLVKDPNEETKEAIRKVRRACFDTIGKIQMDQDKFDEAINSFQQAVKVEKYCEGLYFIAICLHKQNKAEDAMLWYARAEQQGGEYAAKATDKLESIYKAMHDGSLVGIERIRRRAREQSEIAETRTQ